MFFFIIKCVYLQPVCVYLKSMKLNLCNMRIRKYNWTMLLLFVAALSGSTFAQNGDAFFLVDVSGSMKNQTINQEAKEIVLELMQGKFSRSNWKLKGWSEVTAAGNFFSNPVQPMLRDKGVFCLMPFGNMETVRKYKVMVFDSDNTQSFLNFYDAAFPTHHNESWTYLTLAKAYSVVIAAQKDLQGKMIWLIIYSDGMGEHAPTNAFPSDLQEAWDRFGATTESITKKNGIFRKYDGTKHYDIEIWTMGPIPVVAVQDTIDPVPLVAHKFKITSPQNGVSEQTAVEIKKDEYLNLSWANNVGSVTLMVQRMESGNAKKVDNPKDCYTKSLSAFSGKIAFHKSGVYKIILKDSKLNNDIRYVKVKGSVPILPLLLILLAVAGGVAAYKYFKKPKENIDTPDFDVDNNNGDNNRYSNNDNWG